MREGMVIPLHHIVKADGGAVGGAHGESDGVRAAVWRKAGAGAARITEIAERLGRGFAVGALPARA